MPQCIFCTHSRGNVGVFNVGCSIFIFQSTCIWLQIVTWVNALWFCYIYLRNLKASHQTSRYNLLQLFKSLATGFRIKKNSQRFNQCFVHCVNGNKEWGKIL